MAFRLASADEPVRHSCTQDDAWHGSIGPISLPGLPGDEAIVISGCLACIRESLALPLADPVGQFRRYQNGILFASGGWSEQPSAYAICMDLYTALADDLENRALKEHRNDSTS